MKNTIKGYAGKVAPYLFILLGYFRNIIYYFRNGEALINSDASAELRLADLLNETGGFLTDQWIYSTELRVLNTQIVYKLGLFLFQDDWHIARTFSIAVFLLLLTLAAIYLVRVAGLKNYGLWALGALLWPFGQWYAWNVIYCSYYVPHILIALTAMALVLHAAKMFQQKKYVKEAILLLCSIILAFVAGLGGIRMLMNFYAPFAVTAWLLLLLSVRNIWGGQFITYEVDGKEKFIALLSTINLIGSFAGYWINSNVLNNIYQFDSQSETTWNKFRIDTIWSCLGEFINLFGWMPDVKIMSVQGVANILALGLGIFVIVIPVIMFAKKVKLSFEDKILVLFFVTVLLVDGLVYSQTSAYNESYWIPILPFALLVIGIALRVLERYSAHLSVLLCCVYAVVIILCGSSTMKNPYISWVPSNAASITPVTEWLRENNYTQGMSTFWESGIVTELSDGTIDMWTVNEFEELSINPWLTEVKHTIDYPEGEFFILTYLTDATARLTQHNANIVYEDAIYRVYAFDDISEYFATAEAE